MTATEFRKLPMAERTRLLREQAEIALPYYYAEKLIRTDDDVRMTDNMIEHAAQVIREAIEASKQY